MVNLLVVFEIAGLLSLLVTAYWFVRASLSARIKHEDELDYSPVEVKLLEYTLREYGRNTSSIVHMYGDLLHLKPFDTDSGYDPRTLIGYVSRSHVNIMITDPLCSPKDTKETIIEFTKFSQEKNKSSLLFPIDQITARQAAEAGYGLFQVGKEPVFNLKDYSPLTIDKKILSSVNQVFQKGVTIECLTFDEIMAAGYGKELEEIMNEWFLSRRSGKMHLLLEVSPFKFPEGKKYFIARTKEKIEAFLACSPIFARKGYFIHDLIRRPTAMNGIGEALITASLTKFKEDGYQFASLGTAPLAGLDSPGSNPNYRFLNKILVHVFNSHETFMRFKSLYNFKKKFKPTAEEPTFLAFYPPKLTLGQALTVAGLFSEKGFLGDLLFKFKRWMEGDQLPRPLLNMLAPDVVTLARPVPFSFFEFMSRLRFTFTVFVLNIYTYFNTRNFVGELNLDVLAQYGFNYKNLFSHKWFILMTSNFLHFNYLHLFGNMTMLFLFCGTLEFISGSALAALAFLIGMNADIPTWAVVGPLLKSFNSSQWQHVISYMDVGASLGIMGTLGALIQFLKNKRWVFLFCILVTIGLTIFQGEIFGLGHTTALIIGYGVGYLYLHQRYRIRRYQRFFVSPDHPGQYNSPLPFRMRPR